MNTFVACVCLSTLLSLSPVLGADTAKQRPKIRRLISEAWKEPPASMDVLFNRQLLQPPVPEPKLRAMLRDTYQRMDEAERQSGIRHKTGKSLVDQYLDIAVQHALEQQGVTKFSRTRIRYSDGGRLFRMDKAVQTEKAFRTETPVTNSYINSGILDDGHYESIEYDNEHKKATRIADGEKPFWKRDNVWRLDSIGIPNILLLRVFTSKRSGTIVINGVEVPRAVFDATRAQRVIDGENTDLAVTVVETQRKGRLVDRFELKVKGAKRARNIIYTALNDPSRVFRLEYYDAASGRTLLVVESDGFDEDGFPRWWKETTFLADRLQKIDEREIVRVETDCPISEDVFEFAIPKGYVGAEQLPVEMLVHLPDGSVQRRKRAETTRSSWFSLGGTRQILFWLNIGVLGLVIFIVLVRRLKGREKASR